jgi:proline iminopeptidase
MNYIIILFISASALANPIFENDTQKKYFSNYETGYQFCEKYSEIIEKENGFFVTVPIDHGDHSKGKTQIYAYWAEGFYNPELPTVISFDGGPGGTSHGVPRLMTDFNELYFDQRGIACSKPNDLEIFRNPNFYSSINNAYDAEMIRRHLKLEKISVFGGSYGTIPATIYANKFPEVTRALVLEGVLFDHQDYSNSKMINFKIKKTYASLPSESKLAMKHYFNKMELASSLWVYAFGLSYRDLSFVKFKKTLLEVFPNLDTIDRDKADKIFAGSPDDILNGSSDPEEMPDDEELNNVVINCKERSRKGFEILLYFQAEGFDFELTPHITESNEKECAELGFKADDTLYSAADYPFTVPVTYFQGTWDGPTPFVGAVSHFKQTAKGKAQLIVAKNGGHGPLHEGFDGSDQQRRLHQSMFSLALSGLNISANHIKAANTIQSDVFWTQTTK